MERGGEMGEGGGGMEGKRREDEGAHAGREGRKWRLRLRDIRSDLARRDLMICADAQGGKEWRGERWGKGCTRR